MSDNQFIADRLEKYSAALSSASVEDIMAFFVDDGLDYSDYSVLRLGMDKAQVTEFFKGMYASCADFKMQMISVEGNKGFTAWEWKLSFKFVANNAELDVQAAGQEMKAVGCSMTWWNEEDKIVKCHDYGRFVTEWPASHA